VKSEPEAEVRLVGRPRFPNPLPGVGDEPTDSIFKYQVHLWNADPALFAPTANVVAEPVKARVALATTLVEAGKAAALTAPVPGARPGDVVALGPPPNLPARLLFSGVVVDDDEVEVRLHNVDSADATVVGVWTVTAGSGPLAGAPQFVGSAAEAEAPWPNPKAPY